MLDNIRTADYQVIEDTKNQNGIRSYSSSPNQHAVSNISKGSKTSGVYDATRVESVYATRFEDGLKIFKKQYKKMKLE